jgi:hypothetical protein
MFKLMQPIINYSDNKITKIIERVYSFNNQESLPLFFPKDINYFEQDIRYLKKIKKSDPKLINALSQYKISEFKLINNVLIRKQFPLIYLSPSHNPDDTRYLFPDDVYKVKNRKEKSILECINNIDRVILNNKTLDDTILFRGLIIPKRKKIDKNENLFAQLSQFTYNNINYKKNNVIKFDNFLSTTFNLNIALNFANNPTDSSGKFIKTENNGEAILLIIKIKKEDEIPSIFSSSILFNNINNESFIREWKYASDEEFEILLSRNTEFKITNIKVIHNKVKKGLSISNVYDKLKKDNYIKLVFLESLPFQRPEPFEPKKKYKYVCVNTDATEYNNYL